MSAARAHPPRPPFAAELPALVALFCVGLYATSFGPALGHIAADADISVDRAGLLLSGLFAGSITASGIYAARPPANGAAACVLGLIILAAGLAALAAGPGWPWMLATALLFGVGDGIAVAAAHTHVTVASRDVPGAINRLNVLFAVGAVLGPLWAGGVLALGGGISLVYGGLAVAMVAAAIVALAARTVDPRTSSPPPPSETRLAGAPLGLIAVMGAVLFLYVGAEIGLGTWVASYSEEAIGAGVFEGAIVTSVYWGALMLGRLASGVAFARGVPARLVLVASLVTGFAASAGLALVTGSFTLAAGAAFLCGFAFGPVWPCAVSIAAANSPGSVPAAMVTVGNAGGLFFPWLQGVVLVSEGATAGVLVTALLCAVMTALVLTVREPRQAVLHPSTLRADDA